MSRFLQRQQLLHLQAVMHSEFWGREAEQFADMMHTAVWYMASLVFCAIRNSFLLQPHIIVLTTTVLYN